MSQVVRLADFQRGWRCPKSGIVFPKLYYCRGYYHDSVGKQVVSIENLAPTFFSLDEGASGGFHTVKTERIHALPASETGRLIIRHHMTRELAVGYFDAVMDMVMGEDDPHPRLDCVMYETPRGIFTLVHALTPEGKEDGLLVYAVKTLDRSQRTSFIDYFTAIRQDGTVKENFSDD